MSGRPLQPCTENLLLCRSLSPSVQVPSAGVASPGQEDVGPQHRVSWWCALPKFHLPAPMLCPGAWHGSLCVHPER